MKHEFEIQRFYLKWILSIPLIAVSFVFFSFIDTHIDGELMAEIVFILILGFVLSLYFLNIDRLRLFRSKGYWWETEGKICIEIGRRIVEVNEVLKLGGVVDSVFLYRFVYLEVITPTDRIKIHGRSLYERKSFRHTDLYPLFQRILEIHKDLKQSNKNLQGEWYELNKEE